MIFITLGSQKFQFNRLIKAIDELIEKKRIQDEVFAQIGYSDYEPKNYNYKHFLDRAEFSAVIQRADIVITHGGTGAIIGAVKQYFYFSFGCLFTETNNNYYVTLINRISH